MKQKNILSLIPFNIDKEIIDKKNNIQQINIKKMWDRGFTGKGITIAVIDTGCNINHKALKGKIIGGKNFSTDDNGNENIFYDYNGHGTHTSGLIVAEDTENNIRGVAPEARLYILKVLNKDGKGTDDAVIEAINYAISKNVDIISMSLGSSVDNIDMHKAIIKAVNNNISVVCAAGNSGDKRPDTNEYDYPGAYPEVIEVGAVDSENNIAFFSNSNSFVDLVAPGVNLYSTGLDNDYVYMTGTSMATPIVSGALAVLKEWSRKEFNRTLTETEIYAQLIKNTMEIEDIPRSQQGNGFLYFK